ncbi:MAG: hypothetical protein QW598_02705 [Pyrobaculum sp.]
MPLGYGGVVASVDLGPVRLYVWAAVKNGARYLYAQLYAGWRRRKTVYLGKDVNEVAGRIVSATAELGCTAQWSTAEKVAKKLLQEFAVVKAVYNALRQKARERGPYATFYTWARDVIESAIDLDAVDVDVEVDQSEVASRLESLNAVIKEVAEYLEELSGEN